jgi:hypothetical protein
MMTVAVRLLTASIRGLQAGVRTIWLRRVIYRAFAQGARSSGKQYGPRVSRRGVSASVEVSGGWAIEPSIR